MHAVLFTQIFCADTTSLCHLTSACGRRNRSLLALVCACLQLAALGIADTPKIDARSSLARQLMDMYEATGNTLARQV